jgi:hypothetical protein
MAFIDLFQGNLESVGESLSVSSEYPTHFGYQKTLKPSGRSK